MLRLPRWRTAVAAAAVLGLLLPVVSSAAPSCGAVTRVGDGWERVAAPATFAGRPVEQAAASPFDRNRLWAADDFSVVHSGDGGCTWVHAYSVRPATLISLGDDEPNVSQLLASGPPRAETVWVVETTSLEGTPARSIVSSGQTGAITQGSGLPPVGSIRIAVGRDGRSGVAVVGGVAALTQQVSASAVYSTIDAGRTWIKASELPADLEPAGVALSPGGTVYVWSSDTLLRSEDRGRTLQRVDLPSPGVRAVVADTQLVVLDGGVTAHVSRDRGRSFRSFTVPRGATGGAAVTGDVLGVTTGSDVVLVDTAATRLLDVSPTQLVVTGLGAALGRDPALVGLGDGGIVVLPLTAGALLPRLPIQVRRPAPVTLVPSDERPSPASFRPARQVVQLQPGQRRRLDYRLDLPPVPGPLDVYFLVDTTASMDDTIDGMRRSIQDIVDALAATNLDVQIGLGDFRDIDQTPQGSHVYLRQQKIAPPGEGLRKALLRLRTSGGVTEAEADTIALVQAATGSGQLPFVLPGQGAGWRPGTTRVIVHVTDAPFQKGAPFPSREETVAALKSINAKVLGIGVGIPSRGTSDLTQLAEDTGTLAPEGGIDCTGDGRPDVDEGEPAVCETDSRGGSARNVGGPIISLLKGVQQPGRVSITVAGAAVKQVLGRTDVAMDLAHPDPLAFSVVVGCDKEQMGKVLPTQLSASNGTRVVATAVAEVRCGRVPPLEVVAPAVIAALPPPAPPVLQPAIVPPPPAPVQAQPVVNPQAAPQPGTVVNANLVAMTVEQQQEQLELVLAQQEAESFGAELAMVARPRQEEQEAARMLLATALAMATAAGVVGWRRQREPAPRRA